ncbi:hypothetical protein TI39_contig428g00014 [Zymoseptoria brevis]|uniref:MYND-type domain-containing protein n=1 Tax=Zymoseptoria brevis TaxID=1047168 RepID=A0A0F4GLC9_9PEZI|nr:hypothetical protein TI39_contig428g00014 [Zymoseptoria brevis]
MDAAHLHCHPVVESRFARIETSNISDRGYLGCPMTLVYMIPLLEAHVINPHATLIMLFMNAVEEMVAQAPSSADRTAEILQCTKYVPMKDCRVSPLDPYFIILGGSCCMFRDTDKYFTRYMKEEHFQGCIDHSTDLAPPYGFTIKQQHTIVEKWPGRLKLKPGQPGAQEEFKIMQASEHGHEVCYVEWKMRGRETWADLLCRPRRVVLSVFIAILLFAWCKTASGDLRNVTTSVNSLPIGYTRTTNVVVNDLLPNVVVRNIILTLIALAAPNDARAIDCMLHVWYSAFITSQDEELLHEKVLPLIWGFLQDPVHKHKPSSALLAHTWHFSSSSCRVELEKGGWNWLLSSLISAPGLSTARAQQMRSSITNAEQRADIVDRHFISLTPPARVCAQRFRDDGILLPFGSDRKGFTIPNPTFFQYNPQELGGIEWPLNDDADPLSGWDLREVMSVHSGPAVDDVYGKLHTHVRSTLSQFRRRLMTHTFAFSFTNIDAKELPAALKHQHFDRIETSNIADVGYLGIARVLDKLGPLLRPHAENPHATLLAFFMNAVKFIDYESPDQKIKVREAGEACKYFLNKTRPMAMTDATMVNMMQSASLCRDSEAYFSKYMQKFMFEEMEQHSGELVKGGMSMKKQHTIIDKYPYALKIPFNGPGYQEEFDARRAAGLSGGERTIERLSGSTDSTIERLLASTDRTIERLIKSQMEPPALPSQAMAGRDCASCQKDGGLACKNCQLVVYCSRKCQAEHWKKKHEQDCKGHFMKNTWQPAWMKEKRKPGFPLHTAAHGDPTSEDANLGVPLWATLPALDMLQLPAHEGKNFQGDLRVLFAGCTDMANVVKSIGSLPEEYKGYATFVLNDENFEATARAIPITLISLTTPIEDDAIHCMLHI